MKVSEIIKKLLIIVTQVFEAKVSDQKELKNVLYKNK